MKVNYKLISGSVKLIPWKVFWSILYEILKNQTFQKNCAQNCSILLKNKLDFAPRRTVNEDEDFRETLILISGVWGTKIHEDPQEMRSLKTSLESHSKVLTCC